MIAHRTLAGGIAAFAAWSMGSAAPVLAQDFDIFGLGGGNAKPAVSQVDRDFIKEWERNPPKGFPTLSALNILPMKVAIRRYEEIVQSGGWQPIPDVKQMDGRVLQIGQSSPAVVLVAARLAASGDLEGGSGARGSFDAALEKAVKRFQASNGLAPTGIVDDRTATAMRRSSGGTAEAAQGQPNPH